METHGFDPVEDAKITDTRKAYKEHEKPNLFPKKTRLYIPKLLYGEIGKNVDDPPISALPYERKPKIPTSTWLFGARSLGAKKYEKWF